MSAAFGVHAWGRRRHAWLRYSAIPHTALPALPAPRCSTLYLYRETSEATIESVTGKGLAQIGEVLSGVPDGGYAWITRDVVQIGECPRCSANPLTGMLPACCADAPSVALVHARCSRWRDPRAGHWQGGADGRPGDDSI